MKRKNVLIYGLLSISVGYLIYNYLSTDYSYGMMSNHHGYYDNYSSNSYYLNSFLVFISYAVLIISTIILLSKKSVSTNHATTILDQRLSKGEISLEDYRERKSEISSKWLEL